MLSCSFQSRLIIANLGTFIGHEKGPDLGMPRAMVPSWACILGSAPRRAEPARLFRLTFAPGARQWPNSRLVLWVRAHPERRRNIEMQIREAVDLPYPHIPANHPFRSAQRHTGAAVSQRNGTLEHIVREPLRRSLTCARKNMRVAITIMLHLTSAGRPALFSACVVTTQINLVQSALLTR